MPSNCQDCILKQIRIDEQEIEINKSFYINQELRGIIIELNKKIEYLEHRIDNHDRHL